MTEIAHYSVYCASIYNFTKFSFKISSKTELLSSCIFHTVNLMLIPGRKNHTAGITDT